METEQQPDFKPEDGQPPVAQSPTAQTPSPGSEPLQTTEADVTAEDLLADGTSRRKKVTIPFDKFEENNEKAKLYDAFAPLLSKLNQNPDAVDQLLHSETNESLEERLARLEEQTKEKQRMEIKAVVTDALQTWPDFKNHWESVRPIAENLEKQGISYREAIQRAYFAVNPDAVDHDKRLLQQYTVQQIQNQRGTMQAGSGQAKVVSNDESDISAVDKEFAQKAGIPLDLYKKHKDFIAKFADL
jgi:hypothetical protein